MRVFVTGATGFVGSAIVQELLRAGHQVTGLARSDAGAAALTLAGANVHRGDLADLASLKRGAESAEAVIHTGFNHDFSKFKENCEADRQVIEALGSPLVGSARPLIITSATGLLAHGRLATEADVPNSGSTAIPRVATEEAARAAVARGVNVSLVRLPPSVHGDGDHGFVPMLIGIAREKGVSAMVEEGRNRWPAVHRLDAARLYRLVLESGEARGHYHAVAEEGVVFRDIATVIGRRLNLPLVVLTRDEAAKHFGWFAHFVSLDAPASSAWTQERLAWKPDKPGLIADLDREGYFRT